MWASIVNKLLWAYWKLNKKFLCALAETLIGKSEGPFKPDGRAIVANAEQFLSSVPKPVSAQAIIALAFLPLYVSPTVSSSGTERFFSKTWAIVRSHFARIKFLASSLDNRIRQIDVMYSRLGKQAAEQENDLIKTIITLTMLKGLLSASYMELQSTWDALGYNPYPTDRGWDPPAGPNIREPEQSSVSKKLHDNAISPKEIQHISGQPKYCIIGSGAGGGSSRTVYSGR